MFQIRIHGRGGQGVVSAAEMLSVAAFEEGKHSQAVPSFGSERMGAPVVAYVRIDDKEIELREPVLEPDLLIALAQDAVDGHGAKMRPGTTVIADDIMVTNLSLFGEDVTVHWAPLTRTADEVGSRRCANIVALGALSQLTGLLDLAQVSKAVASRAPGKPETNRRAVEAGYALQLTPAEGRAA